MLEKLTTIRPETPEQFEQTRELFREYIAALIAETPAFADYLQMENFADELRDLPRGYAPPEGSILLAAVDDEIAGGVALRQFAGHVAR